MVTVGAWRVLRTPSPYDLKILHYTPVYAPAWTWGGPVVSTAALCEGLAKLGHEVTVYTTNAGLDGSFGGLVTRREGVLVHYFRRQPGIGIKSQELEASVAERIGDFDVAHITGIWQRTSPAACRAATKAGVPYVVSPRGALGSYSWKNKPLKKALYYHLSEGRNLRDAAGFHFTSSMEARECTRWIEGKPSAIISNPVLPANWTRDVVGAQVWRAKRGISMLEPLLLVVGRLHHKKGLDLLPAVLAPFGNKKWTLVFVGDDEDGTGVKLRSSFVSKGIFEHVQFVQQVPNESLPAIYSSATMLLLPSRHENFGNAVVEALGCGCAVAVSDQVGCAEAIADSGAATILPRRTEIWRDWLGKVIDGAGQTNSPQHTLEWARLKFSREALASQMAAFYRTVIK